MPSSDRAVQVSHGGAGEGGKVVADQVMLADAVAVWIWGMVLSEPAASAAGYIGDERSFGASGDVGPFVTEGTVPVTACDVPMVGVGHVLSSLLPMSHI
jgi:hypothetical protein